MRLTVFGFVALPLLGASIHLQSQTPSIPPADVPNQFNVYDGFETNTLSKLWETSRFAPGAVSIETGNVRAGHSAVKIVVHSNDKFEAGNNGNSDSERAELMEARALVSKDDDADEYSFSMFFPADFPIVPVRLVVAQWKQYCPDNITVCSDDSPVLAIRYIGGVLSITQDLERKFIVLYQQKADLRNRWLDFRFQVRFSAKQSGRVKAWLDHKQLVDFNGITATSESPATGYPAPGYIYFKMGLYRNVMSEPMTVYIDEYRKRRMRADEL
jgi:Polysaccharide lyase